ncbi:MAG: hypothetical protein DME00_21820 [Candidatus Rokuibacteriota bacterium]|nr:MAG: hypothetical protein DME00_21820 [Candidatus Rokubacteria bacterium]
MQRAHRQLALSHRQAHDPDVELVGHDRARDLGRVAGDHDQLRLRVARAESPQRGRQQIDAERRAGAEPDASGHDASELLDELEPALELPHRAPGVRQEELARLGRVGPLADTLEQRQPQLLLELSHLHADGRLRESKLARRAGEIPVARDRGERLQVRELDVHDGETKKYLIVTIKTIDFPDSGLWRIMRAWNRAPTPSSCSRRTAWTAPASTPDAGGSFAAAKSCPLPCPRSSAPADRVRVRAARESDLAQIAAIWNYEVLGTDATTDTEPRSLAAQREWLARHTERYPVVVAAIAADAPERDEDVLAYGSLSPYQAKPAFARTVEDSVYVERNRRGAGLGGLILAELIRRARVLEHHSILARITAKNTASLRLHARHGFHPVGLERESAFKLGRWHDVTIMQRLLD